MYFVSKYSPEQLEMLVPRREACLQLAGSGERIKVFELEEVESRSVKKFELTEVLTKRLFRLSDDAVLPRTTKECGSSPVHGKL